MKKPRKEPTRLTVGSVKQTKSAIRVRSDLKVGLFPSSPAKWSAVTWGRGGDVTIEEVE
jgi:hypothetical protein